MLLNSEVLTTAEELTTITRKKKIGSTTTCILALPEQAITFWIILTGWIAILEILGRVYLCQITVVSENERHLSVRDRYESRDQTHRSISVQSPIVVL